MIFSLPSNPDQSIDFPHSVPCSLGAEPDPQLAAPSCQGGVESIRAPLSLLFLQVEHPQLPQPLLIRLVLQPLVLLRSPLWTRSSPSMSILQCQAQNWTQPLGRGLPSAHSRGTVTAQDLLATPLLTVPSSHWPSCPPGHALWTGRPQPFPAGLFPATLPQPGAAGGCCDPGVVPGTRNLVQPQVYEIGLALTLGSGAQHQ